MTDSLIYHPTKASDGRKINMSQIDQEEYELNGWVNTPTKFISHLRPGEDKTIECEKYLRGNTFGFRDENRGANTPKCAVWGTIASSKKSHSRGRIPISSSRADGKYLVTKHVIKLLSNLDDSAKARLTTWLINRREQGSTQPEITHHVVSSTKSLRPLPIEKRAARLLQFASRQTSRIGGEIAFANSYIFQPAMAWSESSEIEEVLFLLDYLKERGWLRLNNKDGEEYAVTVQGYAKLAKLKATDTESSQAFVAMWLGQSMDEAWEKGIRPAINNAGYKPIRIDQKEHANKIDDEIIAEIRRSRFLVADFTHGDEGIRGSVYYETGFAHGLGIPVIFSCRDNLISEIHFDTRQYNHIVWKTPEELRESLEKRIAAILGDGPHKETSD